MSLQNEVGKKVVITKGWDLSQHDRARVDPDVVIKNARVAARSGTVGQVLFDAVNISGWDKQDYFTSEKNIRAKAVLLTPNGTNAEGGCFEWCTQGQNYISFHNLDRPASEIPWNDIHRPKAGEQCWFYLISDDETQRSNIVSFTFPGEVKTKRPEGLTACENFYLDQHPQLEDHPVFGPKPKLHWDRHGNVQNWLACEEWLTPLSCEDQYLKDRADVAAHEFYGTRPEQHVKDFGWKEKVDLCPLWESMYRAGVEPPTVPDPDTIPPKASWFDAVLYIKLNGGNDGKVAAMGAWPHYYLFGQNEPKRRPYFARPWDWIPPPASGDYLPSTSPNDYVIYGDDVGGKSANSNDDNGPIDGTSVLGIFKLSRVKVLSFGSTATGSEGYAVELITRAVHAAGLEIPVHKGSRQIARSEFSDAIVAGAKRALREGVKLRICLGGECNDLFYALRQMTSQERSTIMLFMMGSSNVHDRVPGIKEQSWAGVKSLLNSNQIWAIDGNGVSNDVYNLIRQTSVVPDRDKWMDDHMLASRTGRIFFEEVNRDEVKQYNGAYGRHSHREADSMTVLRAVYSSQQYPHTNWDVNRSNTAQFEAWQRWNFKIRERALATLPR